MGKPSAPQAPDPVATINAQNTANQQAALQNAELNRVNQVTPYGSSTYSVNGYNPDGTPQYQQTTALSPGQQQLYDTTLQGQQQLGNTALGMLGQVQNAYANPISTAGAPGIASSAGGNYQQAQQQAQDAAYAKNAQYLDPQFNQSQKALDQQLANQGIARGSEAYTNAYGDFNRAKQSAYDDARNSAIQQGNAEQNTLFGQSLSNAQLQNSANNQYLQQLFALRNQPLNEYNALTSGAQVQNPQFGAVPGANVATTNSSGIINNAYSNAMQQYNAQMQGYNNLFQTGGMLAAALL